MQRPASLPADWSIADFHFQLPEFVADPLYFYLRLQEASPVHFVADSKIWVVTRYQDVNLTHMDARFSVEAPQANRMQLPPAYERLNREAKSMLVADPPDHNRLRSLVSKSFTPKAVEALRPRIIAIAEELLAPFRSQGQIELMHDFAFHLPAIVIAELLGVPVEDRERFKTWSNTYLSGSGADATPAQRQAMLDAILALTLYFDELIARRREDPRDDLLSGMILAEEAGDKLSEEELVQACILLLIAGHETTTNLIGSGTLALLQNPAQLALLRSNPSLLPTAIEELTRYCSPVQRRSRFTKEAVEVGGVEIPAQSQIFCVYAAANRDPAVFANPNQLDITRSPNPHMGFGKGIHYCLGAPLARLEAEIAFPLLLGLKDLRVAPEGAEWGTATWIRGLKRLPLQFG